MFQEVWQRSNYKIEQPHMSANGVQLTHKPHELNHSLALQNDILPENVTQADGNIVSRFTLCLTTGEAVSTKVRHLNLSTYLELPLWANTSSAKFQVLARHSTQDEHPMRK